MIYLSILSLLVMLLYVSIVCMRNREGVPVSISSTSYTLEHNKWFTFSMISSALLLFAPAIEASVPYYQSLVFLSICGLILVGLTPDYRKNAFKKAIHDGGAIVSFAFSQTWVLINDAIFLAPWAIYVAFWVNYLSKDNDFKPIFWIEICMMNVYLLVIFSHF